MQRRTVVLPDPFGPTSATRSPSGTTALRFSITRRSPKLRATPSNSTIGRAATSERVSVASGSRVGPVGRLSARVGARLLAVSGGVDRMYRWFDRLRSELVAAWASPQVLDRFNEIAYGGAPRYQPESGVFRARLFPFEENALRDHFPPPPARVILGGAGGGR